MFKRVMPLMAVVLVFSVTTQAESRFPGGLALKVVSGARAGLDEVIKTGMVTPKRAEELLRMTPGKDGVVMFQSRLGIPRVLTGPFMALGEKRDIRGERPIEVLKGFLQEWGQLWGLKEVPEYRILDKRVTKRGDVFIRVQQYSRGIKIEFADQVWHFDPQGRLTYFAGLMYPEVEEPDTPLINAAEALEKVKEVYKSGPTGFGLVYIDRSLLKMGVRPYVILAWKVYVPTDRGGMVVYVDAQTGEFVGERPVGEGAFAFSITDASYDFGDVEVDAKRTEGRTVDLWTFLAGYVLTKNVYDHWQQYGDDSFASYDNQDSTMSLVINYGFCQNDLDPSVVCQDGNRRNICRAVLNDPDPNDDHRVAYMPWLPENLEPGWHACGPSEVDNKWIRIEPRSMFHLTGYWNGPKTLAKERYYFDQTPAGVHPTDQVLLHRGNLTQDFVAHEFDHAFNDYTSRLDYYYRSGAIAETLADALAASIDKNNWTFGENSFFENHYHCVRDLSDPTKSCTRPGDTEAYDGSLCGFKSGQPDTFNNYYYNGKFEDWGYIHMNSGIGNKAFYLLADTAGTVHNFGGVTLTSIGRDAAAEVWYYLQRFYLTSQSTYSDFRVAAWEAAYYYDYKHSNSGYPTMDAVYRAMDAVGIWWNPYKFGGWNQDPVMTSNRVAAMTNTDGNGNDYMFVLYHEQYTDYLKARELIPGSGYVDVTLGDGYGNPQMIDFAPATTPYHSSYSHIFAVDKASHVVVHYTVSSHHIYGPYRYSIISKTSVAAVGGDVPYIFFVDGNDHVYVGQAYTSHVYNIHPVQDSNGQVATLYGPSAVIANGRVWLLTTGNDPQDPQHWLEPVIHSLPVSELNNPNAVWDGPVDWHIIQWNCGSLKVGVRSEPSLGVFVPEDGSTPRLYVTVGADDLSHPNDGVEVKPGVFSFYANSDGSVSDVSRVGFVPSSQVDYNSPQGGFLSDGGWLYMFITQPVTVNGIDGYGVYSVAKRGY